jgi:hypothetical protein
MKIYSIKANRKPADVIANNDETLESGLTLDEARIASLEYQRQGNHVAVWIEAEETKPEPRIVRRVERDARGNRHMATYCDNWAV